jgi:hypothetical protein
VLALSDMEVLLRASGDFTGAGLYPGICYAFDSYWRIFNER